MKTHIIPRFILRRFAINLDSPKNELEINVLEGNKVYTDKIADAYQFENFYSLETERRLAKLENQVAKIHDKMIRFSEVGGPSFSLLKREYISVVKFSIIMWRRNNAIKKMFEKNMSEFMEMMKTSGVNLREEFEDIPENELLSKIVNEKQHLIYEHAINITKEDEPVVHKQLYEYQPHLLINCTPINFPLHDRYGTALYCEGDEPEYPSILLQPLSNRVMLIFCKGKHNLGEVVDFTIVQEDKLENIIRTLWEYLIPNLRSIVIDDTNESLIHEIIMLRKVNSKI